MADVAARVAIMCWHNYWQQRTDVWALGCCLYSLAFLKNCFEEGSNLAILSRKYAAIPEDNPYGEGLVEKQKLRIMYGLTEKQFRNLFERAKRKKGVTGEVFLTLLETRLEILLSVMGDGVLDFFILLVILHDSLPWIIWRSPWLA